MVPWLRLCIFKARDLGSVPDQGSKIPHAVWHSQKIKKKKKKKNFKKKLRHIFLIKIKKTHSEWEVT